MEEKTRGVVLIATTDRDFQRSCDAALSEAGFRTVTAHSSHSAESALQRHDIDLFVFDADIFASDPEERPKAVLAGAPHACLVVTNGAVLNRSLRELVASRHGRLLDLRCDAPEVVRVVEEVLRLREEPRAAPDIEESELAQASVPRLAHELGERMKELNYLYSMADLTGQPGLSLKEMLQRLVDMIPAAWQYPEVTCARIVVHGQQFRTENFRETAWKQAADVMRDGERIGAVEVSYLDERPENAEGPFLKEERDLLDAIAQRVGETVSHVP